MNSEEAIKTNAIILLKIKGQYLTQILLPNDPRLVSMLEIDAQADPTRLKKNKVNIDSLQACLIQYAYVCYVCHWFDISISNCRLALDSRQLEMTEPINIYIICDISNINEEFNAIDAINYMFKKILQVPDRFSNQQHALLGFKNQNMLINKCQHDNCKSLFTLLEQTELFRKHSQLLKTKNCSILNYLQVNDKIKLFLRSKDMISKKIMKLNGLNKGKPSILSQIRQIEKSIEADTKNFINSLGLKVFWAEINLSDPFQVKCIVKFSEKQYEFEKMIKETVKQLIPPLKADVKFQEQEFLIEYSCERSSICVKYITTIPLSVENSDLLMFQFNNLSFDSSSVSLELHEKNIKSRFLAFKATSCLLSKQSPIEKILLLMDITMITAKVIEPQVLKPSYAIRDFTKPQQLHRKISHYIAILNFVAKKVYQPNQVEQQSKQEI